MKKSKILTAVICAVVLMLGVFSRFGMTASATTSATSGYCGAEGQEKNVTWSYQSGILTISFVVVRH